MDLNIFNPEIREHLMQHGRFTWVREILFAISLYFISKMPDKYPIFFYSFLFILMGVSLFNMWLCQVLNEWNLANLKIWDWSFAVSSTLQYILSSVFISTVFYVDGPVSWSGFAALMMWLSTLESVAQLYYHRTKFFYPLMLVMVIPAWASLIMHVHFDFKISLVLSFVASLYCFSISTRVEKWRQKNKQIEALYLKIEEERSMIQKLFDMIPAKISWIDSQSKYKMVNQGLTQHLRVSPKSLLGSEFGFTQNPEFKELNHKIKSFILSQLTESSFEYPVKTGNELRRHHVLLKKINSAEGQELIMMTLDIEDFKKAQEKIKAG
jgi:hypothetical protein